MAVKIVDASALGALVFGEPEAEAIVAQLSSSKLAAPRLLWFELSESRRPGLLFDRDDRMVDDGKTIAGSKDDAGSRTPILI